MNCPSCHVEFPTAQTGKTCPACGGELTVTKKSFNGWLLLAVLAAPALGTMLVAQFRLPDLTVGWVLISSPLAGLIAGFLLARASSQNGFIRFFSFIFFAVVMAAVCLVTCFFGCALAGDGGVRIGG